ncbi:peptidoglycan DD-metalloendopeptidase family protein [Vibrio gallicus]|uniref:peptidoglycan DD-metalloendopeptidase family protein n=1 Tax=Vibrio gallicus TaxID=190897 RepID=UPI0021C256BC|nr:peptidoglycan DD-metalloendopeptidase family protein [Vibrio gallicus]
MFKFNRSQLLSNKKLLLIPVLLLIVALFSHSHEERKFVQLDINSAPAPTIDTSSAKANWEQAPTYSYHIKRGDNLSVVFSRLGFSYQDLMRIMEEDLNHLSLDKLKPGNILKFWADEESGRLVKMELEFTLADRVQYTRGQDDSFAYKDISLPGTWETKALVGKVYGSFSTSAHKLGLSSTEIEEISNLLKDKLNFVKELRAGDKFSIVHKVQYIDGQETGNREVEAINIYNQGRVISAYLHNNGQFFDENGDSLQRAFDRYPSKYHRITSPFNPHRLHPVTGRLAPHNGTDFGAPLGSEVHATGDGKVIMIRNHPYAGKYIVLEHGPIYKTRYLHLSKILVKKGQKVKRGDIIALSGATGRVTGPHLHFELLVRNRPVNAVTANIPMADSVPKDEMKQFVARRNQFMKLMKDKEVMLAKQTQQTKNKKQAL